MARATLGHDGQSICRSSIRARNVRSFDSYKAVGDAAILELAKIGISFPAPVVHQMVKDIYAGDSQHGGYSMDAAFNPAITTASIPTPLQFLQQFLTGFVKVMTAARKADKIVGIKTVGSWEDQEVVQGMLESSATVQEYTDSSNIPFQDANYNFERRNIVRLEAGIRVGVLEEARTAAMRASLASDRRQAAGIALEIARNSVAFFGWQSGTTGNIQNRTFGLLNDPYLPSPQTIAGGSWLGKTFLQITADLRLAVMTLRSQSQDTIDPEEDELTLVLPTNRVDYLTVTSDFGVSVRDWLTQTYPKIRIISAPEFNGSETDTSVVGTFYLFAENIDSSVDGSSDGGETFVQLVQTKFMTVGVRKDVKEYVEDYSNAMAGVMCKRPWAVTIWTGI